MRRFNALFVCGLGLVLGCAGTPGCQSGQLSGLLGKDAMSLLAPYLKDAANSYLTNINSLIASLQNVRSLADAVNVAPKVEPAARDASKAYKTLASATPEERRLLWEAFGPRFESANSGFLGQAERLNSDPLTARAVKAATDQVRLFTRERAE